MHIIPTTLRKANDFVAQHHRHNGRTTRNGGKFAVALEHEGAIVGVAIVGNPLSATYMDGFTAEVLRACVSPNAPKGANSRLYATCKHIWQLMGGKRLLTYTLQTESGASLRGAGWTVAGKSKPCKPGWRKEDHLDHKRTFQPVMALTKLRWEAPL